MLHNPAGLVERLSTWSVNHFEQLALPVSVVPAGIVLVAL